MMEPSHGNSNHSWEIGELQLKVRPVNGDYVSETSPLLKAGAILAEDFKRERE